MNESLTQQLLNLIYQNTSVRRAHKDSLSDWVLDTQSRNAPLNTSALLDYLAIHQPELLDRLKVNVHVGENISHLLESVDPN